MANLQRLLAFSLHQVPFLPGPPHDSLPSPTDRPGFYGQFWVQYAGHDVPINADFGVLFECRAKFRIIVAQYCSAAYREHKADSEPTDLAYYCRLQLLEWFNALPVSLRPGNIVLPAQLQLQ